MKKVLWIGGGVVAAVFASWVFLQVFSGQLILNQSFSIGSFSVHYYGLVLGVAVLSSYFVTRANAWRFGLSREENDRVVFWTILVSIIGARLYFVLFEFDYFSQNPNEIWKVWNGGLSLYGAILGGLLFLLLWSRKRIYSSRQLLDLIALALPLGQAIGRLGNFFNYESYGRPTDLPWKMFVPEEFRTGVNASYYHPVFLYESLLNLIIFFVLLKLRGKLKAGNLALVYLLSYSAIRFFLESLRMDSVFVSGFRIDQIVSAAVFLAAARVLWRTSGRS